MWSLHIWKQVKHSWLIWKSWWSMPMRRLVISHFSSVPWLVPLKFLRTKKFSKTVKFALSRGNIPIKCNKIHDKFVCKNWIGLLRVFGFLMNLNNLKIDCILAWLCNLGHYYMMHHGYLICLWIILYTFSSTYKSNQLDWFTI